MDSKIQKLIERGALFVINDSGGKDSQAMKIYLKARIPANQLLIVHANLPGVDWSGTEEHVREYSGNTDVITVRSRKTFFEMVRHRGMWPSAQQRQCTSDLKRDPIDKAIRAELKRRGLSLVVSCLGLRAEESSARSKCKVFRFDKRNSKAGREWYQWLPIHGYTKTEVFQVIADAGQKPHWAYLMGMERLSCCFCIMASRADLKRSAELNPELYAEYVQLEKEIDHSFVMPGKGKAPKFLEEITGIKIKVVTRQQTEQLSFL